MRLKDVQSAEKQTMRFNESRGVDELEVREDMRLLIAISEGDQQAFAALYRRRGGVIYSLLRRILVNPMEAEEAMQDTFLQIWRRAHQCDPERSSPLSWMVLIARSKALDRLRARSRRQASHAEYEREVASLEVEVQEVRQMERDELAAACRAALNGLPEAQARALQLAFLRGWTQREIASAMGEPLGTIKAWIRRGLLSLRKIVKDYHA